MVDRRRRSPEGGSPRVPLGALFLAALAGACAEVTQRGGSVWTTDKGRCFVKVGTGGSSAAAQLLKYEAEGLARMAAAAPSLSVPKPWLARPGAGPWGRVRRASQFISGTLGPVPRDPPVFIRDLWTRATGPASFHSGHLGARHMARQFLFGTC